jgi:uncharacterized protein (UPF0264 family)
MQEPEPGKFDFSGNPDLAEYIRTAQNEGIWARLAGSLATRRMSCSQCHVMLRNEYATKR